MYLGDIAMLNNIFFIINSSVLWLVDLKDGSATYGLENALSFDSSEGYWTIYISMI